MCLVHIYFRSDGFLKAFVPWIQIDSHKFAFLYRRCVDISLYRIPYKLAFVGRIVIPPINIPCRKLFLWNCRLFFSVTGWYWRKGYFLQWNRHHCPRCAVKFVLLAAPGFYSLENTVTAEILSGSAPAPFRPDRRGRYLDSGGQSLTEVLFLSVPGWISVYIFLGLFFPRF